MGNRLINKIGLSLFLFVLVFLPSCQGGSNNSSDRAMERLNGQFKEGKFEEMYLQISPVAREVNSKVEFVEKLKLARGLMSRVDPNFEWKQIENPSHDVFDHMSDVSFRKMEKKGESIVLEVWWSGQGLCAFGMRSNFGEPREINIKRGCS